MMGRSCSTAMNFGKVFTGQDRNFDINVGGRVNGRLSVKHAVQCGIWVPVGVRKTLIDLI
jgi:hypothetical protein